MCTALANPFGPRAVAREELGSGSDFIGFAHFNREKLEKHVARL